MDTTETMISKIRAFIQAGSFAPLTDELLTLLRPAIRLIEKEEADDGDLAIGASKLGGLPDLPPEQAWPTTDDGTPLSLAAQIRLSDVAPFDLQHELPPTGLLSFFLDRPESGEGVPYIYSDTNRVIAVEEALSQLARRSAPTADLEVLPARALICSSQLMLPPFGWGHPILDKLLKRAVEKQEVEMSEDQLSHQYEQLRQQIEALFAISPPLLQMLGYAFPIQGEAAAISYDESVRLLFQLDDSHINFGDCGMGYFFIEKGELLADTPFSSEVPVSMEFECY
ncbi:hypothetical protein KSF_001020 [Reticulibacter mediterranei]|uniref:DUF1963 domain-containing protein n=1 Tax=Reticulibacter mediterranei TaxID=2778369 RepID=A0A8J3MWP2_9CHLR|nr:YwqG family protein [Reticulibacter mediterranei]GHO90054.1 hypothetical protein KSF_001020 [Reticulibacter mediterranei]